MINFHFRHKAVGHSCVIFIIIVKTTRNSWGFEENRVTLQHNNKIKT